MHARAALLGVGFCLATLLTSAAWAQQEYVVQWTADGADTSGYRLFVGPAPGTYDRSLDFGLVLPDADGVRRMPTMLDETIDQHLAIAAYGPGGESAPSNEILVAAAACDATACDDGNPCTVDSCTNTSCTQDPLPDWSLCASGGSVCLSGACTAVECLADGDCSDGDACTGAESCSATGSCMSGTPPTCASPSVCLVPLCDPLTGCGLQPAADGLPCDDGLAATSGDSCSAGVCAGLADTATTVDSVQPDELGRGRHVVAIHGTGFVPGSTLSFESGEGPIPRIRSLVLAGDDLLQAEVEVRKRGPKRARNWDVVVTSPDGSRAVLADGLRIVP